MNSSLGHALLNGALWSILSIIALAAFSEPAHANSILYEIVEDPHASLYRNGVRVGSIGFGGTSLAWYAEGGVLLTISETAFVETIIAIDPLTGAGSARGSFSSAITSGIHGLEFNPLTGILYGIDTTRLYTIDPNTAAISFVVTLAGLTGAQALTFDGSGNAFVYDSDLNGLYSVNIATGQTSLLSQPTQYVRGLAWNPDTGQLYLSPNNGATIVPGTSSPVPEPFSIGLLAAVSIGLVARRQSGKTQTSPTVT